MVDWSKDTNRNSYKDTECKPDKEGDVDAVTDERPACGAYSHRKHRMDNVENKLVS